MKKTKSELEIIPGVGKSIAQDLEQIGYLKVSDLKDEDPEKIYEKSNKKVGVVQDRCLLYTFRCAVYYASHSEHDPELLKWWNWKDRKYRVK